MTEYLKSGKKYRHFNVLSYLIRRNERKILEDVKLLNRVISERSHLSSPSNSRRKRR
ncbi:MAG TPA: hypothetical protein VFF30_03650 [Nitrososphaerales archaeon]|nr:hypothetical protein [Nitrososphaerales archaeon]